MRVSLSDLMRISSSISLSSIELHTALMGCAWPLQSEAHCAGALLAGVCGGAVARALMHASLQLAAAFVDPTCQSLLSLYGGF